MPKHEEKLCPRCSARFECKSGDILQCQCYGISFSEAESSFMEERYKDCLCRNCLLDLKNRYIYFTEKYLT